MGARVLGHSGSLGIGGHFSGQLSPRGSARPVGEVTGFRVQRQTATLCTWPEEGPPRRRFPDQILDQRHTQTKAPGPAWREGQPHRPSAHHLPRHLSPVDPSCLAPARTAAPMVEGCGMPWSPLPMPAHRGDLAVEPATLPCPWGKGLVLCTPRLLGRPRWPDLEGTQTRCVKRFSNMKKG